MLVFLEKTPSTVPDWTVTQEGYPLDLINFKN